MLVCERGTMFGYTDLVVDPRNLVLMRDAGCPVTCDVTHALQQPAGKPLEVGFHPSASDLKTFDFTSTEPLILGQHLWKAIYEVPVW